MQGIINCRFDMKNHEHEVKIPGNEVKNHDYKVNIRGNEVKNHDYDTTR